MRIFAIVAMAALGLQSMVVHASPADDLKALLERGQAKEAWDLGRRHADQLGNPVFDLYYGIAAINAGKATDGVLALERVLLVAPDNQIARLELARGYYLLGEDARSREEFEVLLAAKPAPPVAKVIADYLDALRAREGRFAATLTGYLEFGGGHDSNVPSGVEDPNITLPVFGEITLADSAVRLSDRFMVTAGGIRFSRPLKARMQAFAAISGEQRSNRSVDTFDQELFAGVVGLNWQWSERTMARVSYSMATQTIDHRKYRDNGTLSLELGQQLTASSSALLGLQKAQFRHGGFNAVRDADYQAASLGVRWRSISAWRPELDLAVSTAREEALLQDRQDLSRDLRGARMGLSCQPGSAWTVSVSGQWLQSDYKAPDPLLLVTREDRYKAAELAITWTLPWLRNTSLRSEWTDATNRSNLALYEYKRRAGALKLRHDFK